MLKKYSYATILAASLFTGNAQAESRFYIGASSGLGYGTLDVGGYKSSASTTAGTVFIGIALSETVRMEINYDSNKAKSDGETDKFTGFNADWLIALSEQQDVNPYFLVGFGVYQYKDTAHLFDDNEDLKGVALNLGTGVSYKLNRSFEVDLGYTFKYIRWQDIQLHYATISSQAFQNRIDLGLKFKF